MGIHIGVVMTALEDIQLAITKLEASLEQDFMTDAVRDIMTTAVAHLRDAESQLICRKVGVAALGA
jgi:hypothetical protein